MRLIANEKCLAAATTCTLHVAMETENSSTKDDDSDFATVNPTGLSWDVQAEALVTDNNFESGKLECNAASLNQTYPNMSLTPIHLRDGDQLVVSREVPSETYSIAILDGDREVIASAQSGHDISHTATEDETLYLAASGSTIHTLVYSVSDDGTSASDMLDLMESKLPITVRFSYTTGQRNREEDDIILEGLAYISDYSLTATNRQNSVYTVTLTGTGELSMVDDDSSN